MSAAPRLPTTLVTGPAGAREAAIARLLAPGVANAVILEGLPLGDTCLAPSGLLAVHRIAPGCLCCTGQLVLRVTLNRLLRQRPARLFIGPAPGDHLDQLRSWLCEPPYDQLLELTPDVST
ncbi:GTPase [Massilia glaciei]|uniref:GTPase n=1 Tax=Massilia glaciei TaxID=1524097 RepID=A0A2U2I597_9BURK|nr:GTPase [Massilia glaciei]PWF54946.1 GTPase [Massilia glaciei]